MKNGNDVVNKLWSICDILRADGMHIATYIEQITILLFLKMLDEKQGKVYLGQVELPKGYDWNNLKEKDGMEIITHYEDMLRELSQQEGILGEIFGRVKSAFREPVNLRRAVIAIDEIHWSQVDIDVKGAAYEGLLEKYAREARGAGQYFTPRGAIRAIVKCIDPKPDDSIHDPAVGTGGFIIGAYELIMNKTHEGADLTRDQRKFLKSKAFSGGELVAETRRLALMNLLLHGIEPDSFYLGNSLTEGPHVSKRYDVVMTNPPFGGTRGVAAPNRDDFPVKVKSPELNFVQHIITILKADGGRAAVVVPTGVLENEGPSQKVREVLMEDCNLHTIIILPKQAFYPYSVIDTAIMFFTKGEPTKEVWFYDLRTGIPNMTRNRTLDLHYFEDFIKLYNDRKETERFHKITIDQIKKKNYTLAPKEYGIKIDIEEYGEEVEVPPPKKLLPEIKASMENIKGLLDDIEKEIT